jgi:hypothetical protein
MTRTRYRLALAISIVAVFFTNLAVYLSLPEVASVNPWYWIAGLALACAPLYLSGRFLLTIKRAPLAMWCYGFVMITCVWLLLDGTPSKDAWEEVRMRILVSSFLLIGLCVFADEIAQLWTRRAILIAVLLAVGVNVYELFRPLAFSMVIGRSAGLYANPTQCGAALVLGMIFSIGVVRPRYRLLYALVVGAGVALTVSRGPMLSWFVSMMIIAKMGDIKLKRSLAIGGAVLAAVSIILIAQWDVLQSQLMDLGVLNEDTIHRIEDLADARDFGVDESTARRKAVASEAWETFSDNPVVGRGVAASKQFSLDMSSHNQYLNLMVDHGIFGLFVLPAIALAAAWRARGETRRISFPFVAFILLWGFFSHNVLTEFYILMMFSLLAAMSISSRFKQTASARIALLSPKSQ